MCPKLYKTLTCLKSVHKNLDNPEFLFTDVFFVQREPILNYSIHITLVEIRKVRIFNYPNNIISSNMVRFSPNFSKPKLSKISNIYRLSYITSIHALRPAPIITYKQKSSPMLGL